MLEKLNSLNKAANDKEYIELVKDIINNEVVKEMKKYRQHYDVNTFEHCMNVSYISYKICKKLKILRHIEPVYGKFLQAEKKNGYKYPSC